MEKVNTVAFDNCLTILLLVRYPYLATQQVPPSLVKHKNKSNLFHHNKHHQKLLESDTSFHVTITMVINLVAYPPLIFPFCLQYTITFTSFLCKILSSVTQHRNLSMINPPDNLSKTNPL